MKHIIRLTLLAMLLPAYLWANVQPETNDTLYIQRNEQGKVQFVRFNANEKCEQENDQQYRFPEIYPQRQK